MMVQLPSNPNPNLDPSSNPNPNPNPNSNPNTNPSPNPNPNPNTNPSPSPNPAPHPNPNQVQLLYTVVTLLPVVWLWESFALHLAYLLAIYTYSIWNGGSYYIEVFSKA